MDKLIQKQKGFSTIEIMIAMAIIVLSLTATFMVSSGNQSILVDSQTNSEALTITQKALEQEQALARKDFKLVNSHTSTITLPPVTYTIEITVTTDPNGVKDFFTKKIIAKTSWGGTFGRNPSVSLTALATNFENAVGGDTCDSNLSGDWTNAEIKNTNTVTDPITDVDAYEGKLYVTTNNSSANNSTFYIFNIDTSNPNNPKLTLQSQTDNSSVNAGLNAVTVATSNIGSYAYVANGYGAAFTSCTQGQNCAQLQIFNINNITAPPVNFKVPGVTGTAGQGVGNTIFYKNGYIYLGLTKTNGPEFNIIDVHNPNNPVWVGGYEVNNWVNAVYVRGSYAYLATPNNEELIVLDISNPSNPIKKTGYDAPGGSGNGKSINIVGDNVYLGRTLGGKEFYTLNVPAYTITPLGDFDVNSSVNAVIVRDYLSFLLTSAKLRILNTSNPTIINETIPSVDLSSGIGTAMDCEGNNIFIGTDDGTINIITP